MSFEARTIRFSYFLIALCCFCSLLSNVKAQGYVDILPDDIKNPFLERQDRIVNELSGSPADEWEGRYFRDFGLTWGDNLLWGSQNGFAAFRDTCSNGPRAWVNYGAASFRGGVLTLIPEREDGAEYVLKFPLKEFTPVKWGDQHWLVPTEQLALFAHAINSRSAEDYESFYIKTDDLQKPRKGLPNLSLAYKQIIGRPPVNASVVAIRNGRPNWYPQLTINVGKNRGVIEGMSFWLVGVKNVNVKVTVAEVRKRTSVVDVTSFGTSDSESTEIMPKRGWRFSSRYSEQ